MIKLDWEITWTFVNLIVFYLILRKVLFGPVNAIMEQRSKEIEDSIELAKNTNLEAQNLKSEYEQSLLNAKTEAVDIKKEAKVKADQEYNKILKSAKEDAAKVMADANKAIEEEREKSIKEIQSEISGIALLAAAKIMQKNVDEDLNKDLVEHFLMEAGVSK